MIPDESFRASLTVGLVGTVESVKMGLLKHALIPMFGVLHIMCIYASMDLTRWTEMTGLASTTEESVPSQENPRQWHMLGHVRGCNAAMLLFCIMGAIGGESSHFRGILIWSEVVCWAAVAWDAYELGLQANFMIACGWVALALLGALVNANEPGIFTVDKKQQQKTKKPSPQRAKQG